MLKDYKEKSEKLLANKIFAVIRLNDSGSALEVIEAVISGGIVNIEITLTTPDALSILSEAINNFSNVARIGVGSVLNLEHTISAMENGAEFIVSPVLDFKVIEYGHKNGVPVYPGGFTPTEIYSAHNAGADAVKVFPADILGMKFFRAIKAPMPQLKLIPTGGVSLTNIREWLNAGASAVGIGSALLDKQAIKNKNYQKIADNAKIAVSNIKKLITTGE